MVGEKVNCRHKFSLHFKEALLEKNSKITKKVFLYSGMFRIYVWDSKLEEVMEKTSEG